MRDTVDENLFGLVLNSVENTISADADAIAMFKTEQLPAASRSRIVRECADLAAYPLHQVFVQGEQRFQYFALDYDFILQSKPALVNSLSNSSRVKKSFLLCKACFMSRES